MTRYRGYRSDSRRLQHYDYAQGGWYHLVARTDDGRPDFGTVRRSIMGLSVAGCIAAWAWPRTLQAYPRAVEDAWIVMPNHVHLILGLRARSDDHDADAGNNPDPDAKTRPGASQERSQPSQSDPAHASSDDSAAKTRPGASQERSQASRSGPAYSSSDDSAAKTRQDASQQTAPSDPSAPARSFGDGLVPHSVSSIMNHYKGRVTKTIRRYDAAPGFAWQPRFYDRIIRSERELQAHRRYVARNPAQWADDRNHPDQ